jgi:hypothetical protein
MKVLRKYRAIEPESIASFLIEQGWTQLDIMPGVVSLWGIEDEGETQKVLLPLDANSPDYPNKVIQTLEIIGRTTGRSEFDLVELLSDLSAAAIQANRDLVDLRLLPNCESSQNEFPVKPLGSILQSLQNLIDSIGKAVKGIYSSSITGPISKEITDRTRLLAVGAGTGSFIVKLASEKPESQLDWIEQEQGSLEQQTLNAFLELIDISHQGDPDVLRGTLEKLQRRTVVAYRKFLEELSSANSGIEVRLGSFHPRFGGKSRLNSTEILGIIELLTQVEPQIPEVIHVDGILSLAGKTISGSSRFIIKRINDSEPFEGRIDPSVLEKDIELTVNRRYRAIIEETESVNPVTNESTKNLKLVDIFYLEDVLEPEVEREVRND